MIEALLAAPLVQGIGLLGTLGGMLWPLFPGRRGMLAAQTITSVFFTIHYALLGAQTGAVMNSLSAVQAAAAIPLGTRPGFRLVYLATTVPIAAGLALTWNGWPSLFAAAGTLLITLARYQVSVVWFRVLMAVGLPCWFGHNLMVVSVPGMISDVVGMTVNGVMLVRLLAVRAPVREGVVGENA
mgnify:CR=1 FL=1